MKESIPLSNDYEFSLSVIQQLNQYIEILDANNNLANYLGYIIISSFFGLAFFIGLNFSIDFIIKSINTLGITANKSSILITILLLICILYIAITINILSKSKKAKALIPKEFKLVTEHLYDISNHLKSAYPAISINMSSVIKRMESLFSLQEPKKNAIVIHLCSKLVSIKELTIIAQQDLLVQNSLNALSAHIATLNNN